MITNRNHEAFDRASHVRVEIGREPAEPQPLGKGERWWTRLPEVGQLQPMEVQEFTELMVSLKDIGRALINYSGWYARDEVRFVERILK